MDLEYKPTVDNIILTKDLDKIVTASIKWILEKDLPALKQMTRLQFWFRKAYDLGKNDAIKTATIEELKQNPHVQGLLETLKEIEKSRYSTIGDDGDFQTPDATIAREALKEWE